MYIDQELKLRRPSLVSSKGRHSLLRLLRVLPATRARSKVTILTNSTRIRSSQPSGHRAARLRTSRETHRWRQAPPPIQLSIQRPGKTSNIFQIGSAKLRKAFVAALRIAANRFSELSREADQTMGAATELDRLLAASGFEASLIRTVAVAGDRRMRELPIRIGIWNSRLP